MKEYWILIPVFFKSLLLQCYEVILKTKEEKYYRKYYSLKRKTENDISGFRHWTSK